jgi:hypothetical protein
VKLRYSEVMALSLGGMGKFHPRPKPLPDADQSDEAAAEAAAFTLLASGFVPPRAPKSRMQISLTLSSNIEGASRVDRSERLRKTPTNRVSRRLDIP